MLTSGPSGSARRMSMSLRADSVVVANGLSDAVVWIWISTSVGGRNRLAFFRDQHVREDGQGVPAFDNAGHGGQRFEDRIACSSYELHLSYILLVLFMRKAGLCGQLAQGQHWRGFAGSANVCTSANRFCG
jgi:hypothetical protein